MKTFFGEAVIDQDLFDKVHLYKGREISESLFPEMSILLDLEARVRDSGHHPFISELTSGKLAQTLTYKEFFNQLKQVTSCLDSLCNIGEGQKVAVLPTNSVRSILAILGVMARGAVAVIINPNEPPSRINEQIISVGCQFIIDDSIQGHSSDIRSIRAEQLMQESRKCSFKWIDRQLFTFDSPAVVMFTTGTTASSKAILQMHYSIRVNCAALVTRHALAPGKRLLCVLPIFYANGLEFTIFSTMISGAHVVLCDQFDPFSYLKIVEKHQIHIASLVPSLLSSLTGWRSSIDLSQLSYFVSAAAPLSKQTSEAIFSKFSRRIVQGYGLTETTNFSTLVPTDLSDESYRKLMIEAEIPPIGTELFGNEVQILDDKGNIMPNNEEGEICMRGHSVMAGYLRNLEITRESFKGGWFHSGDLGKKVRDPSTGQEFFTITGRIKHMIKVAGQAVSLEEIDRILQSIPGVGEAITCSVPDSFLGEIPVCLIVLKDPKIQESDLRIALGNSISKEKHPHRILFVSNIPRTRNGKVNRRQLAKDFFQEYF